MATFTLEQTGTDCQIHHLLDELVEGTEPGVNGFVQAVRMLSSPDFITSLPKPFLASLKHSERSLDDLILDWALYLRERKRQQEAALSFGSVKFLSEPNSFSGNSSPPLIK